VIRQNFVAESSNELSVSAGEVVSLRHSDEKSGWTLGVVVANGSKKEGWFPDWCLTESKSKSDGKCSNCGVECVAVGFVKLPGAKGEGAIQGAICSATCWEKWIKRITVAR
jgi:hypothetical protein